MTKIEKEEKIKELKQRRALYLQQEEKMLTNGVQSYGIGSRNVQRYQMNLANIQKAIKDLEEEIKTITRDYPRKAVGVIPRDW